MVIDYGLHAEDIKYTVMSYNCCLIYAKKRHRLSAMKNEKQRYRLKRALLVDH